MKINEAGLNIIKASESLRLEGYLDPVGLPTIGWGHLIKKSDPYRVGTRISVETANQLLRSDVATAERDVALLLPGVELNENQFSALVSFVFNLGINTASTTRVIRYLRERNYTAAAASFGNVVFGTIKGKKMKLPGLVIRRDRERKLFETPVGV